MTDVPKDESAIVSLQSIPAKGEPTRLYLVVPTPAWDRLIAGQNITMNFDTRSGSIQIVMLAAETTHAASDIVDQIAANCGIVAAETP